MIRSLILPRIYGPDALDPMRRAGKLTAQCLREVGAMVAPGVSTKALDDAVAAFCTRHGAVAAPLDYHGFPAHCCTSVNHVVAHGIPRDRALRSGDIVKVDVALIVDGWHGDTCATFPVGEIDVKSSLLIKAAKAALDVGIATAGPMRTTGDIGHAINSVVRKTSAFSVVEGLCGHGIGLEFHGLPDVPNVGRPGAGARLLPGMFITIEPMINAGQRFISTLADGTIVTRDRSRSAQFEHTIAITDNGVEILTV